MIKYQKKYLLKGQSLVEVLIALAVGIIFVLGIILAIQFLLKVNRDSEKVQIGSALASELMDNVKIFVQADWHNILNLATTSINHYYLNTTTTPFSAVSGEENIILSTTTYVRYFYVDDVYRDETGKIVSGSGTFDPSTKKITVVYRWEGGSNRFITSYVTRSHNNIFIQTDWSGGGGQLGPITSTNNKFDTSTNIDFSTTSGSILLKLGY